MNEFFNDDNKNSDDDNNDDDDNADDDDGDNGKCKTHVCFMFRTKH